MSRVGGDRRRQDLLRPVLGGGAAASAEQALRPHQQHQQEQAESDRVLIGGREEAGAEAFDEAEDEPPTIGP